METTTFAYDVCQRYVRDFTGELGSDLGNKILGWVRSRSLSKLAQAMSLFDPENHGIIHRKHLMQVEAFFKKNDVYTDEEVCSAAALSSFLKAEKVCRITNRRLAYYYSQRDRLDPDLRSWMARAEAYISSALGSFDVFRDELTSRLRVTAGASSTRGRRSSQPHRKVRLRNTCTPGARKWLTLAAEDFGLKLHKFKITNWNRVEFVPKNWSTHRTIACEPEGVIPLQLAFDGYAKECLLKRKINLFDQSRNQRLARQGSVDDSFATIDLSSASDSESYMAVLWLFPEPWFRYLDSLRSSWYRLSDGTMGRYAKFSSMGNGTTFTTETLIFAASCHAVGSKAFSVYGDDIIIEKELVGDLIRMLRFLGFSVNGKKSYTAGPFRESCGGNYYLGVDITPFYIRTVDRRKTVLSHLVNGLATIGLPEGELWQYLRSLISEFELPLVPFNESSISGVHIDAHEAYRQGLIRTKQQHPNPKVSSYQRPEFRSLVVKVTKVEDVVDSRTYFLWFLDKNRSSSVPDPSPVERSRVPAFDHKYVRKWVGWYVPATGTPVHLYWWAGYILAVS